MPLEINEDGLLVLQASGWDNDVDVAPEGMEGTKYTITGHQSQVITFKLSPGEMLRTEAGIMLCATEGISPESEFVGCSGCCSGEGCCYVNYKNDQDVKDEYISCTPNFPTAKVVPVDLSSKDFNGKLKCQQGAFIASFGDVDVTASVTFGLACCAGGVGFIQQSISGSGVAFLSGVGTVVQKRLEPGEKIIVDTNCILAWADSVELSVRRAGNFVGIVGAGEGIFNTELTGPGMVIVQSYNEQLLKDVIRGETKINVV